MDVEELFADFEDAGGATNEQTGEAPKPPPPAPERIHRSDKLLALKAESILK